MRLEPCPWIADTLQLPPTPARARSLLVLLHGWGSNAQDMAALAPALSPSLPDSLVLAPEGFEPAAGHPGARQWFDVQGMTPANRAKRMAQALTRLLIWLDDVWQHTGVSPDHTVLAGFSQGASLALELALLRDGLVSRVLAFAGRCGTPPVHLPRQTALHFLQGDADPLIPVAQTRVTIQQLGALGSNVTLDLSPGLGHGIDATLLELARRRLA